MLWFASFNSFYQEPIIMTKYGCLSALANILPLFPQFCFTMEAPDTSSALHRLTTDTMNDWLFFSIRYLWLRMMRCNFSTPGARCHWEIRVTVTLINRVWGCLFQAAVKSSCRSRGEFESDFKLGFKNHMTQKRNSSHNGGWRFSSFL